MGEVDYDNTDNTITVDAEEVATELSMNAVYRSSSFSWTVNTTFISTYFGDLFDAGTLSGPGTTTSTDYTGALTPMAILREIENNTGGEFQIRYEYNPTTLKIERYIDYLDAIGSTHSTIIDLQYNALEIGLT
jgi:hypothetical protein